YVFGNNEAIDLAPLSNAINLSKLSVIVYSLQKADLSPLSSCKALTEFILRGSYIQEIDLSPLQACQDLRTFELDASRLQNLDLTPLQSNVALTSLDLSVSQLRNLDLTPLQSNIALTRFKLSVFQLRNLDLAPLSSLSNLTDITLATSGEQMPVLDISPLISLKQLKTFNMNVLDVSQTKDGVLEVIKGEYLPTALTSIKPQHGTDEIPEGLRIFESRIMWYEAGTPPPPLPKLVQVLASACVNHPDRYGVRCSNCSQNACRDCTFEIRVSVIRGIDPAGGPNWQSYKKGLCPSCYVVHMEKQYPKAILKRTRPGYMRARRIVDEGIRRVIEDSN
ncbi:MAG: hypothetical protein ACFE7R_04830, partial [Candidatus Hodarchaeota archaeon]